MSALALPTRDEWRDLKLRSDGLPEAVRRTLVSTLDASGRDGARLGGGIQSLLAPAARRRRPALAD